MKKYNKKNACLSFIQGFTMIEVLVSMAIFSIVMVASTSFFASFIKSSREAEAIQEDLEEAQFALNFLAKNLRTSSIVVDASPKLRIYDYSQDLCIEYDTSLSGISMKSVNTTRTDCDTYGGFSSIAPEQIVSNNLVDWDLLVDESIPGSQVGKVTILARISRESDDITIQTTVSLRDYTEAEIVN